MKKVTVIGSYVSFDPPYKLGLTKGQVSNRAHALKVVEDNIEDELAAVLKEDDRTLYQVIDRTGFKKGEVIVASLGKGKATASLVASIEHMEAWEKDAALQARYQHNLNAFLVDCRKDDATEDEEIEPSDTDSSNSGEAGAGADNKTPGGGAPASTASAIGSFEKGPEAQAKDDHINKIADTIKDLGEDAFDGMEVNLESVAAMIDGVEAITPEEGKEAYQRLFDRTVVILKADDMTANSGPKVEALETALGFPVTADERDELWTVYNARKAKEATSSGEAGASAPEGQASA